MIIVSGSGGSSVPSPLDVNVVNTPNFNLATSPNVRLQAYDAVSSQWVNLTVDPNGDLNVKTASGGGLSYIPKVDSATLTVNSATATTKTFQPAVGFAWEVIFAYLWLETNDVRAYIDYKLGAESFYKLRNAAKFPVLFLDRPFILTNAHYLTVLYYHETGSAVNGYYFLAYREYSV